MVHKSNKIIIWPKIYFKKIFVTPVRSMITQRRKLHYEQYQYITQLFRVPTNEIKHFFINLWNRGQSKDRIKLKPFEIN